MDILQVDHPHYQAYSEGHAAGVAQAYRECCIEHGRLIAHLLTMLDPNLEHTATSLQLSIIQQARQVVRKVIDAEI